MISVYTENESLVKRHSLTCNVLNHPSVAFTLSTYAQSVNNEDDTLSRTLLLKL